MENRLFRKSLVFSVIILLISVSIIPSYVNAKESVDDDFPDLIHYHYVYFKITFQKGVYWREPIFYILFSSFYARTYYPVNITIKTWFGFGVVSEYQIKNCYPDGLNIKNTIYHKNITGDNSHPWYAYDPDGGMIEGYAFYLEHPMI